MDTKPKTLQDAIKHFGDPEVCIRTVAEIRWPNGPVCPKCHGKEHYYLATQKRWKCKECSKQFSVKVGTIFEDSPIALDKWLVALWMLVNCKNGVSSYEIARDLGITQKSAWFVLQRLRLALQKGSVVKLGGKGHTVEVDETFIGGASRFMNRERRRRACDWRWADGENPCNWIPRPGAQGGACDRDCWPSQKAHPARSDENR